MELLIYWKRTWRLYTWWKLEDVYSHTWSLGTLWAAPPALHCPDQKNRFPALPECPPSPGNTPTLCPPTTRTQVTAAGNEHIFKQWLKTRGKKKTKYENSYLTIYLFEVSTQCSIDGSFIFVELLLKQQNKAGSFRRTNKMTQTFTEAFY